MTTSERARRKERYKQHLKRADYYRKSWMMLGHALALNMARRKYPIPEFLQRR
jgi:hypothetical protein